MPDWLPLGTHLYRVEDDVFVLKGHGELSLEDTKDLLVVCHEIGDKYGYWLVLVDAHAGVRISAESRRHLGEISRAPKYLNVTAVFGAGLIESTLVQFISNAIKLVHGHEMPIEICKTQEEARSWLGEQRQRLQQTGARPKSGPG
jgi:hypothetical protein